MIHSFKNIYWRDFPDGPVVKNPPDSAEGTIQLLVQEDPTCSGATKAMRHNYWGPLSLDPLLHNKKNLYNERPVSGNSKIVPTHCP